MFGYLFGEHHDALIINYNFEFLTFQKLQVKVKESHSSVITKSVLPVQSVAMELEVERVDPVKFLIEDCLAVLFTYLDPETVKTASLVSR